MNSRKVCKVGKHNAKQNKKTLDMQHAQYLNNLEEAGRLIETYTNDIKCLNVRLSELNQIKVERELTDDEINEQINVLDKKN